MMFNAALYVDGNLKNIIWYFVQRLCGVFCANIKYFSQCSSAYYFILMLVTIYFLKNKNIILIFFQLAEYW